jgi:PTS system nitrogen regulatory IIA component
MITVEDLLPPDHVSLHLKATTPAKTIEEVAALLKGVPEVLDWPALLKGVQVAAPCLAEPGGGFALCIPHTRGDCVSELVMAAGRSEQGVIFPGVEVPVRYVFCIGVPKALAADYLRIVGLLARVFKDPAAESELRAAATAADFVELLSRHEAKL